MSTRKSDIIRIGLISDTHGLLRPEAVEALRGVSLIIHAGDVGSSDVLAGLKRIAPVVAVGGNMDGGAWARPLRPTEVADAGGRYFYVLHDLHQLDINPVAAGFSAVVSGHTHLPWAEERDGVWYLNPGSAGPARRGKPVCLMLVHMNENELRPEVIHLVNE